MKVVGSGTIEQLEKGKPKGKCSKWKLWATTDDGRKSKRFSGSYTQAQAALAAFVEELGNRVCNGESFSSYAQSWRTWREKSGDLSVGTITNDKRNVSALVRSPLAGMRMDEISPEACRDALLWVKTHPVNGKNELSGTSMNKIYITLNAIMQQAEDDGRMAKNPLARIKAPKVDTKEKDALTPEEIAEVIGKLDGMQVDGRVMALYLILFLGLRRGEACAIYAEDVHDGIAEVKRAVKERTGQIEEPKTKAGIRKLPIPPQLSGKIAEWMDFRAKVGWGDAPTLCCNTQGGVLRPQLLQRWWSGDAYHNGVRDDIGCSGMTLHQLRHSNLSMMARYMSPFDLQRYAGWASIEPAKVYIHEDMDKVASAVSRAWGARTPFCE